jgi:hypothetical protein
MRRLFIVFCVFVLIFASCGKKTNEKKDARGTEYIENYITQLKEIEKMTAEKFNKIMYLLEYANENYQNDSVLFQIRDAIIESISTNKKAIEEFRELAAKQRPDFVDDTVQILLRTATAFLVQSYEIRTEALSWLNRYISLGTPRFFREYSKGMEEAMHTSRQAFFFLTTARVRQKVVMGDTLDMTIEEFLNIPELPVEAPSKADIAEEAKAVEEEEE